MEQIVKTTREVGTSAGVLLPRSWLNKEVVVTLHSPSKQEITKKVIDMLAEKELLVNVIGIYLIGSYARGEERLESDIDVLVVTNGKKGLIKFGNYEISVIPEKNLLKNLKSSLYSILSVREAKPLVNEKKLEEYKKIEHSLNLRELINEIRSIVKVNRNSVEDYLDSEENVPDGLVYSVVLRARELYSIKSILKNRDYEKEKFLKIVGEESYRAYSRVKMDKKDKKEVSPKEAIKLIELSEKWLKELKELRKAKKA